ncbi:MAG TPA: hypothetical protein VFH74_00420 [Gaiellales bacterium]|nr:hypothetical protein [Gaiellales bacterium]
MPQPPDHQADKLLTRLLDYLTARRAFELAVEEARRKGWSEQDIQRVTGLSTIGSAPALRRRGGSPAPGSTDHDRPAAA